MRLGPFKEEKAVVIDKLRATVQVEECGYIFSGGIMDQLDIARALISMLVGSAEELTTHIAGLEVESGGVELVCLRKIGNTHSEMTQFVHWRRAFHFLDQ